MRERRPERCKACFARGPHHHTFERLMRVKKLSHPLRGRWGEISQLYKHDAMQHLTQSSHCHLPSCKQEIRHRHTRAEEAVHHPKATMATIRRALCDALDASTTKLARQHRTSQPPDLQVDSLHLPGHEPRTALVKRPSLERQSRASPSTRCPRFRSSVQFWSDCLPLRSLHCP